jgi:catechol 2,3-dioxygenase-like lactoylglutathione lyase family enzyme
VSARWWHVGLTVSDMDRSLPFYRDVVGMEIQHDDLHIEHMEQFDALSNNSGSKLRVAWLTDGVFILQLIQYLQAGGTTLDLHHNNIGSPHLSFWVDDADAKYAEVQARGDVVITSEVIQLGLQSRSFYTEDPDGVPVEFFCNQHNADLT